MIDKEYVVPSKYELQEQKKWAGYQNAQRSNLYSSEELLNLSLAEQLAWAEIDPTNYKPEQPSSSAE